jgi:gluconokinase
MIVLLMGVSGSGKTTIGSLLAERTGAVFADADDFHPAANKQKMAAGIPLTDQDRQPWLETLNRLLRGWVKAGTRGVLACSALKQSYRQTLGDGLPPATVCTIFLDGSKDLIAARLAERHHEFMNASLLDSQMQTLEPPADGLRVINDRSPGEVVNEIMARLRIP